MRSRELPRARGPEDADPNGSIGPPSARTVWDDGLGRAAVRGLQLTLIAVPVVAVLLVLVRLRLVVVPLLIALLIASAAWPLVSWLRRRGLPAPLAALAALLAGVSVLSGLTALVVWGIRGEWDELRQRTDEGLRELERLLASDELPIDAEQIEQARASAVRMLSGSGLGARAADSVVLAGEVVAGISLALVMLFFLLKDGPKIWAFLRRAVPAPHRPRVDEIAPQVLDVLGNYVRGVVIIALFDATIIGATLFLLGVPLALPLAVLVFLTAFIPLLGAIVSGAFAALVALVSEGPVVALIVVAVVVAVNQLENDILGPIVYGHAMQLHPLTVLLALSAGTILAGIIGALLAVPVVAALWVIAKGLSADPPEPAPPQ